MDKENVIITSKGITMKKYPGFDHDDLIPLHPEHDEIFDKCEVIARKNLTSEEVHTLLQRISDSYCGIVEAARTKMSKEDANGVVNQLKHLTMDLTDTISMLLNNMPTVVHMENMSDVY